MHLRFTAIVASVAALVAAPVAAHEFWIEPDRFEAEAGALLAVGLRVGDAGLGEVVARNEPRIERFVVAGPKGERDILGSHGSAPAGRLRLDEPGLHVLGFRNKPTFVELSAEAFTDYLKEEGLDPIVELREALGISDQRGRELFSRCAKSLVRTSDTESTESDRTLGLPLELHLETNPWEPSESSEWTVRLVYRGKPLAGAQVKLLDLKHSAPHGASPAARTDAEGRVRLPAGGSGRWMLASIHMVQLEGDERADWESLWASLTFEVQ